MSQRPLDRDLEVREIDRLGDEVEGAAVHRGADVLHVAVGRDDDRAEIRVHLGDLLQEGQTVHLRHVDVRENDVDVALLRQDFQRLDAVAGELEAVLALADVASHALAHQTLQIRLVVNDQDLVVGMVPIAHLDRYPFRARNLYPAAARASACVS